MQFECARLEYKPMDLHGWQIAQQYSATITQSTLWYSDSQTIATSQQILSLLYVIDMIILYMYIAEKADMKIKINIYCSDYE